jgi:hypothetical protein
MDELEFEYKYHIGERYKNIYYLNNSFISLDDEINIYGTTFWTNPPFHSSYEAKLYVNDYNYMTYYKKDVNYVVDLDTHHVRELAKESFIKLKTYLNENNKKTIVVTHFPPIRMGTSHPKFLAEKKLTNLYFAWPDDTLEKLNLNNILAWISGHTHWSYDFKKNGVRLISNQLGYKSEIGETGLNEDGSYEIDFSF